MASPARRAHQASISATGDRLRRLMKDRGVSVAALAAATRIQQSTLRNFREGHRSLPDDVLEAIARELGTSKDFLMDRSKGPRPVAGDTRGSRTPEAVARVQLSACGGGWRRLVSEATLRGRQHSGSWRSARSGE